MSTDKHDEDFVDPDATKPAQKSTIPPPGDLYDDFDPDGEEATVMAQIPEALLAESLRSDEDEAGGLKQLFGREGAAPKKEPTPERDAIMDMLFEDAKEERPTPVPEPAVTPPVVAAPPPRPKAPAPPPRPKAAIPPPRPTPAQPADEASFDLGGDLTEPVNVGRDSASADRSVAQNRQPLASEPETVDMDPAAAASLVAAPAAEVAVSDVSEMDAVSSADEAAMLRTPIPSRAPPPSAFADEEDASAMLVRLQQRDAWAARAEWLRAEALLDDDKATRARGLLVVSELFAMSGEEQNARAAADQARELVPNMPMAHRQARGLSAREADWTAVLDVIEAEARATVAPAARVHAAILGSEIARLCQSDEEGQKKRVELAARLVPADPRAHVQRLAEALAAPDPDAGPAPATKVRVPDVPELAPLNEALHRILAERGYKPSPKGAPPASPYEALLAARTAATSGDHAATIHALGALAGQESPALAKGAGWLLSVLGSPRKETRARAAEALKSVLEGSHAAAARRALAGLAIELGDAEAAKAATATASSDAFTAADRVTLGALAGGARADIDPWVEALVGDDELKPIAAAACAALGGGDVPAAGGPSSSASAALGRALARASAPSSPLADLRGPVTAFADASPESGVGRALTLELDADDRSGGKVALALSTWREDAEGERERVLAGALIAEASGEVDRAASEYERARSADPRDEAATRAALAYAGVEVSGAVLKAHAEALDPSPRAALLLTEAAVRAGAVGDEADAIGLLRRAAEADPKIPLGVFLGSRAARASGDREGVLEWIRVRREASDDAMEQAYDLVREARLLVENDAAAAASLLEQALRARPSDVGLRELFERISPEPPPDRASWRSLRATEILAVGSAPKAEAARLALEAALELERAGDLAGAARASTQAITAGEAVLAPIVAHRAALAGHGAGDAIDALLPRAREATDPVERLEIYERLADLDEHGRGEAGSALLTRRAILEDVPGHLPTLRRVASALVGAGRDDELEPIALAIARVLEGPEAIAHAQLAARLRARTSVWEETREAVEIAFRNQPRGIWALRQMAAHARVAGEHGVALEVDRQIIERTQRPSEAATLSLRVAEAASKDGRNDDSLAFYGHAIELVPNHIAAHLAMAAALERAGSFAGAAASLTAAANACASREEQAHDLYQAAILWQDKVKDTAEARNALERVAELDPAYGDVFQRLQAIYIAEGAKTELAELLKRRLDAVTDPAERVEMEVLRGRALADVGDSAAAKAALAAALEANPDHADALSAFAAVAAAEEDWPGAEQAWIRLARLASDPAKQTEIYFQLGKLYDEHLPNPERAELAYQEILKRTPASEEARERLVALYQRQGNFPLAIEQQTTLINAAEAPERKCARTAELAQIYEVSGDAKKAEATLLQARKTWPKDDVALTALARFYQRNNQSQQAATLLDRAVADARRALGTGRFEPYLFSTVAAVAELRNRPDAAKVAKAAVAALEGESAELDGAGLGAADMSLDDLLAPEVMTPSFRELLRKSGSLFDAAVPFDLGSIRAAPLPPQMTDLHDQINTLADGYGLGGIQIHVSSALGAVAVPASSQPPVIVLGQSLVASPREDVRSFLLHRALKILQTFGAGLSRTAPIDLWPLVAAFLKAHSPSFAPQGVDQGKLTDYLGKVTRARGGPAGADTAALAADVIGSIGNRASTLNTVINGWGNRAGLLAVGDLNIALAGIAWAGGHANAPPAQGKDRMTWIGRNAEARELVVFSVTDAYADARTRLDLT